jgi:NAD(P)-dependent dehydrogenase (short-subunit alcohol dehydrogenase family)/acyl carrier protein
LDLDPVPSQHEAEALCGAILAPDGEDEIALRGDRRFLARLARRRGLDRRAVELHPDATYLITGGGGGVGLAVARWMVEAGARNLVLVGRGPLNEHASEAVATLQAAGVRVAYLRGDVSCAEDVATIFATLSDGLPPLRGIVHGAGVLADATLLQQTPAGLHAVLAPKVAGAWNLAAAARELPLDFLVFFSSASALLGIPGQSNYAAANAVLDALAHYLRGAGIPAVSIAWGRWGEVGLATTGGRATTLDRLGVAPMTSAAGVAAFGRIVAAGAAHLAVLDMRWATYLARNTTMAPRFADMAPEAHADTDACGHGSDFRTRLESALPTERGDLLVEHVRTLAAAVMHFDDPLRILPGQGFFQIGMDSLTAVELKNRLQQSLGLTLPATTAFDYPTPATLARRLLGELFSDGSAPVAPEAIDDDHNGLSHLSRDELRGLLDAELQAIDEELVR